MTPLSDPLVKSALHMLVDHLAIAQKKLSNAEDEAAKIPTLEAETKRLKTELMNILDKYGFDAEAVELLLAAR